jgi:hypothetical protein
MTNAMDLALSVDEQRTQELLRMKRTLNKKLSEQTEEEYYNLFRKQGMVKV